LKSPVATVSNEAEMRPTAPATMKTAGAAKSAAKDGATACDVVDTSAAVVPSGPVPRVSDFVAAAKLGIPNASNNTPIVTDRSKSLRVPAADCKTINSLLISPLI
jgi:hypothetical protein